MVLGGSDLDDRYKKVVSEIAARNRSAQSDMNALYDKSVEADKKVEKYAGQSSEKLTAMIEEVSLPSASFALNNLREQLDEVLSLEAAVADSGEDRKRLTDGLAALKKAVNSAKQAEMVNTKQLKVVSASLKALEDEINRKLKINDTLRTKIKNLSSNGKKRSRNSTDCWTIWAPLRRTLSPKRKTTKYGCRNCLCFVPRSAESSPC